MRYLTTSQDTKTQPAAHLCLRRRKAPRQLARLALRVFNCTLEGLSVGRQRFCFEGGKGL
jgi:hypothetical protein